MWGCSHPAALSPLLAGAYGNDLAEKTRLEQVYEKTRRGTQALALRAQAGSQAVLIAVSASASSATSCSPTR